MIKNLLFAVAMTATTAATTYAQPVTVFGDGSTTSTNTCVGATDSWCATNLRAGGSVGVTTDYARNGNGSLYFSGTDGVAKADYQYLFSTPFALKDLSSLSFDYFRDGTSTNPANQAPAFRLIFANDALTLGGYLIYEPVYNGVASIPVNSWQTVSINDQTNLWLRRFTPSPGVTLEEFNIPLGEWKSEAGVSRLGANFNGDLNVVGFEVGTGSGWNGAFKGAVDNISYQSALIDAPVTFNFEVASAAVPEPSSALLLVVGAAGLFVVQRRRRA